MIIAKSQRLRRALSRAAQPLRMREGQRPANMCTGAPMIIFKSGHKDDHLQKWSR